MHICKIYDNDLTEYQVWYKLTENFKKALNIFSPQIERKRSKECLVLVLAVKDSFERFSCLKFIFENNKYREAGLKHKLISFKLEDSEF